MCPLCFAPISPQYLHTRTSRGQQLLLLWSPAVVCHKREKERRKKRSVSRLLAVASEAPPAGPLSQWHRVSCIVLNSPVHFACVWCRVQSSSVLAVHSFSPLYLCFKRVLRHGAYVGTQHGFFFFIVSVSST